MAFTKNPAQDTYSTEMILPIKVLNSRGSTPSKDQDYLNYYPETIKNRDTKEKDIILVKRPGTRLFVTPSGGAEIRGMHFWEQENYLFVATSNNIYMYDATLGTLAFTLSTAFGTTSGHVGFCEFLYDDGTVKVVATDGTTLITIDNTGTKVVGVDADMPAHLPYLVFLDGYLFMLKLNTADIYNSDLNNPLVYTAGNFLSSERQADRANYIAKLNNYIIVTGNQSIEYFWDAAGTTSPLLNNDTPIKLTGLQAGYASLGNKIFFIGNSNDSSPDVFVLEDFKITPIGNEAVRRHLASLVITNVENVVGTIISVNGHDFYTFSTNAYTYCYEMESKLWTRLGWQATDKFQMTAAANANTGSISGSGNKSFFSLSGGPTIYHFDTTLYQDNGTTFPCICITAPEEFDTMSQKTMSRLIVWADSPSVSSTGTIQWTDDDYQTYNTGATIDLFNELPATRRLGRFRQRAFKWTYTQNQPHRLQSFEVNINKGQH